MINKMLQLFSLVLIYSVIANDLPTSIQGKGNCSLPAIRVAELELDAATKKVLTDFEDIQLHETKVLSRAEVAPSGISSIMSDCAKKKLYCYLIDDKIIIHKGEGFLPVNHVAATKAEFEVSSSIKLDEYLIVKKDKFGKPLLDEKGNVVKAQACGGLRCAFLDKSKRIWKKFHGHFVGSDISMFIEREKVTSKATQKYWDSVSSEIGLHVKMVPHDYKYAQLGWVSQHNVEGYTVAEYRRYLKEHFPDKLKSFDQSLEKLKPAHKKINESVSELIDRNFEGKHFSRKKETLPDGTTRSVIEDVDLGDLELGEGQLSNCRVNSSFVGREGTNFQLLCFDG